MADFVNRLTKAAFTWVHARGILLPCKAYEISLRTKGFLIIFKGFSLEQYDFQVRCTRFSGSNLPLGYIHFVYGQDQGWGYGQGQGWGYGQGQGWGLGLGLGLGLGSDQVYKDCPRAIPSIAVPNGSTYEVLLVWD